MSNLLWHTLSQPVIRRTLLIPYRHLQLALLLLKEFKKGSESKWHPYIAALPASVNTLLHWTEEELKELQYSTPGHEQQFLQEVWCPWFACVPFAQCVWWHSCFTLRYLLRRTTSTLLYPLPCVLFKGEPMVVIGLLLDLHYTFLTETFVCAIPYLVIQKRNSAGSMLFANSTVPLPFTRKSKASNNCYPSLDAVSPTTALLRRSCTRQATTLNTLCKSHMHTVTVTFHVLSAGETAGR